MFKAAEPACDLDDSSAVWVAEIEIAGGSLALLSLVVGWKGGENRRLCSTKTVTMAL